MAQVLLLTTARGTEPLRPYQREDYRRMQAAAEADRFRKHTLADDPGRADLILFVGAEDADYWDVRTHPYVKRYQEKCFLFDSGDRIIPFLPGVYASIERRYYSPTRTRSGFYLRVFENDHVEFDPHMDRAPWLFSFLGAAGNAPVRKRIAALNHPRGLIMDSSSESARLRKTAAPAGVEYQQRYGEILRQSKYILCPRGYGTSSWRLFEAMKAGRVPVILSDQWVPPSGPNWEAFSLRVRERDITRLPRLLEADEERAPQRGLEARRQWEEWFSREVAFHRVVEWCLSIREARRLPEALTCWPVYLQLLRPYAFRHYLLGRVRRFLGR